MQGATGSRTLPGTETTVALKEQASSMTSMFSRGRALHHQRPGSQLLTVRVGRWMGRGGWPLRRRHRSRRPPPAGRRCAQPIWLDWPPSTGRIAPVTNPASSEARNSAACTTSHAVPCRPSGMRLVRSFARSSGAMPAAAAPASTAIGVSNKPGITAFARMPCRALANARFWVSRVDHLEILYAVSVVSGRDRHERRDVDDGTGSLGSHVRDDVLAGPPHGLQVHVEDAVPRLLLEPPRRGVATADADVVVEDVDPTEHVHRRVGDRGARPRDRRCPPRGPVPDHLPPPRARPSPRPKPGRGRPAAPRRPPGRRADAVARPLPIVSPAVCPAPTMIAVLPANRPVWLASLVAAMLTPRPVRATGLRSAHRTS